MVTRRTFLALAQVSSLRTTLDFVKYNAGTHYFNNCISDKYVDYKFYLLVTTIII